MLSPTNAPAAPARITRASCWLPAPAATPPAMTAVSLGTTGITESSRAITNTMIRNHQFDEMSSIQSVTSVMMFATMILPPLPPEVRPAHRARGDRGHLHRGLDAHGGG